MPLVEINPFSFFGLLIILVFDAIFFRKTPMSNVQKKEVELKNLLIGAGLNIFETSTLGQPFEVTKTQVS